MYIRIYKLFKTFNKRYFDEFKNKNIDLQVKKKLEK